MKQPKDSSHDTRSLFRHGSTYGNIVLNFQYAADGEFGFYASAFHEAGQALFERMFDKGGYNDLEGCPIIFLYRHSLELYLKAIVLHGDAIFKIQGNTLISNRTFLQKHSLLPFLPLVKQTFDSVGWTWDLDVEGLQTFDEVEAQLRDFESVDLGSYTFRYPVDTKGNPSVPHHFMVHMPTFCKRMDALLKALEAAVMGLEVTEDRMLEAAYAAQADEEELNETLDCEDRQ